LDLQRGEGGIQCVTLLLLPLQLFHAVLIQLPSDPPFMTLDQFLWRRHLHIDHGGREFAGPVDRRSSPDRSASEFCLLVAHDRFSFSRAANWSRVKFTHHDRVAGFVAGTVC
jgi:hypothetical protein